MAAVLVLALALTTAVSWGSSSSGASVPSGSALSAEQQTIAGIAREAMTKYHLQALIVRVTTNGQNTYTGALGESMTGVPATVAMHVRNGYVAYTYLTTMLMEFVDRKKISLDDKLSTFFPDLPEANAVTIKMLAYSTSGYADYVYQPSFQDAYYSDPFREFTPAELIKIGTSAPPMFAPGTNVAYSHTNYVILGEVLAKVGRKPLDQLMRQYIFRPMGLKQTQTSATAAIPNPVLHTFSSERRTILGIPPTVPFYEETTYWNPSWAALAGSVQTTDVADLTTSIQAIGSGKLLSPQSHRLQVGPNLVGFGHPAPGCPGCRLQTPESSTGMAVILLGKWINGNRFYGGNGAVVGYLPSRKLAIAVITTYQPAAFDPEGNVSDAGPAILTNLSKALAPESPIPSPSNGPSES